MLWARERENLFAKTRIAAGVGVALLAEIVALARRKGLSMLMLETGTGAGFEPAHRLYTRGGFVARGPFLDYPDSQWSAFFEMPLAVGQPA